MKSPFAPRRRAGAGAVTLAALLAFLGSAIAAQGSTHHTKLMRIVRTAPTPGTYTVLVTVKPTSTAQTVTVAVGHQEQTGVSVGPGAPQQLAFFVPLRGRYHVDEFYTSRKPARLAIASALQSDTTSPPGPHTNLVWSDEFRGPTGSPPNPANWTLDPTNSCGSGTLSQDTTSTANASLSGTGLNITAIQSPPGSPTPASAAYTSALLDTATHYSFNYGRIEARIWYPPGSGVCSQFWLLQTATNYDGCDAPCGEMDVAEINNRFPNIAWADLHAPAAGQSAAQVFQSHVTAATPFTGGFHTYGLIWGPNSVSWTLDGLTYATATPASLTPAGTPWVFNGLAMRVLLDLAVGGWAYAPTNSSGFPATMQVAWVRVYQ